MTREQELQISLTDMLMLVETNQLVRNPLADDKPDWMKRMIRFVEILKRATDLVAEPPSKEPAVTIWLQCCVCRPEDAARHYCAKHLPIGDQGWITGNLNGAPYIRNGWIVYPTQPGSIRPGDLEPVVPNNLEFERSVSEQLQADLEPITNHGKKFCV